MGAATDIVNSIGVSFDATTRMAVVAGHYCLSPELASLSHDQETEASCFAHGVDIVRNVQQAGGYVRVVLWINDIGIDAAERARIKQDYQLPENYRQIIDEAGLTQADVQVLFESAMRNKASTTLQQLAARKPHLFRKLPSTHEGLVRCIDTDFCSIDVQGRDAYVIDGPNGVPLVVKEGPNPKCNLILATLFNRIMKDHQPDAIVNVFNAIYVNRIALGVHVSRRIYDCAVPMANLFVDGTEIVDGTMAGSAQPEFDGQGAMFNPPLPVTDGEMQRCQYPSTIL
jgi:hypothetical protein